MSHVQPDLDILLVKLTAQIRDSIRKTPSAHSASGNVDFMQSLFFCNILNCDLYIDALIPELFWICLVVSQTLEEGTLQNVFVDVLRKM